MRDSEYFLAIGISHVRVMRTDRLNLVSSAAPSCRCIGPAAVTSVIYHYSVTRVDIHVIYEICLETTQDGAAMASSSVRQWNCVKRNLLDSKSTTDWAPTCSLVNSVFL